MKNTTLGGISGAFTGIATLFLIQTFDGQLSDTVLWAILLTLANLIMLVPPLFINVVDNRNQYVKDHPMVPRIITICIFGPFAAFSLYVMISNGSINNGIFNLATTVYALGAVIFESYKLIKRQ